MTIEDAIGWATWTVENTDMGMARILKRASEKFEVKQSEVRRAIYDKFGEEYLSERAERMIAKGRQYAPSEVKEKMKSRSNVYKENQQAERHIRDIKKYG